ncbi:MAG: type 4a pilus biogenesis protein PilO [Deltaproteobacteria bacterium]|nr:type 4a pilus biogenesis protein PilO [bacterium]MCB9477297.1 type 4a pilus biogenesis protein PilO [Deltaproteobacteria bacterium]MCB9478763.1 type 4a pilus biogenesis protein PilO [Deltaproteobacteria bacterium]MCB9488279.1 type 4a pilus biogenesis protein PilO [Deltaproteobacteria bacterium]
MENSKKILIIVALMVVVCVIYLFMFYNPKKEVISDLQAQLEKKIDEARDRKRIAQDIKRFEKEAEELDLRLKDSLAQLPEDKNIPGLLKMLANLANISGIELTSFTVLPEAPRPLYAEVPIELQMTGNYHNIAIFFDKISKQDRIINISNVKLSQPTLVGGETRVNASCTVTAFRFVPQAQPAAAAAPPPKK